MILRRGETKNNPLNKTHKTDLYIHFDISLPCIYQPSTLDYIHIERVVSAYNDPPFLRAVYGRNIVECRRLIDRGEANVNGDIYQFCAYRTTWRERPWRRMRERHKIEFKHGKRIKPNKLKTKQAKDPKIYIYRCL